MPSYSSFTLGENINQNYAQILFYLKKMATIKRKKKQEMQVRIQLVEMSVGRIMIETSMEVPLEINI